MAYKSQPTVTRPANTTAYNAGDVVGGAITFDKCAANALAITSADLGIDVTAIPAGMTSFRLHLYNATPPSALADNAAWTFTAADRAVYLGYVDVGSPALLSTGLFCQVDAINKQIEPGSTGLFGYLVTNGAFTPAANSEVYRPRLYGIEI